MTLYIPMSSKLWFSWANLCLGDYQIQHWVVSCQLAAVVLYDSTSAKEVHLVVQSTTTRTLAKSTLFQEWNYACYLPRVSYPLSCSSLSRHQFRCTMWLQSKYSQRNLVWTLSTWRGKFPESLRSTRNQSNYDVYSPLATRFNSRTSLEDRHCMVPRTNRCVLFLYSARCSFQAPPTRV